MTISAFRVWSEIGRGALAPSIGTLSIVALVALGCSDSDDEARANPLVTTPAPDEPGAGLDADRPDPCRGVPLPADQAYIAPGLCASAVAFDQSGLRQIGFADNGDLIGVRTSGEVVRFRDANGDGMFDGATEISVIGN